MRLTERYLIIADTFRIIFMKYLTLSYTAINEIATFTAVDENGRCNNNGI